MTLTGAKHNRKPRAVCFSPCFARAPPRCFCHRQRSAPHQITAVGCYPSGCTAGRHKEKEIRPPCGGLISLAPQVGLEPTTLTGAKHSRKPLAGRFSPCFARAPRRCFCHRQRSAPHQITAVGCYPSGCRTVRHKEKEIRPPCGGLISLVRLLITDLVIVRRDMHLHIPSYCCKKVSFKYSRTAIAFLRISSNTSIVFFSFKPNLVAILL